MPATDGLIHLAYVAQVTNTTGKAAEILDVVAVEPLADFAPTGRNFVMDFEGNDVTGKVRRFPRAELARALFEATYFAGLRKAGMPEE